jgi:hypothetical protein
MTPNPSIERTSKRLRLFLPPLMSNVMRRRKSLCAGSCCGTRVLLRQRRARRASASQAAARSGTCSAARAIVLRQVRAQFNEGQCVALRRCPLVRQRRNASAPTPPPSVLRQQAFRSTCVAPCQRCAASGVATHNQALEPTAYGRGSALRYASS